MRCEQYRQEIDGNPSAPAEHLRAHVAACPACAAYLAEMRELDGRIARALAIDVPELSLPELSPATPAGRPAAGARRWLPLAAAAGIAAAALLLRGLLMEPTAGTLAEEVIAHMDHEQASRQVTNVAVSGETLERAFDGRVSAIDGDIGLVSYAVTCVIRGNRVPHLVVQGARGPVTLILLPDERIEKPIPLEGVHVHGVILPVGDGSVAVIGEREEQMPEVRDLGRQLAGALEWRT